MRMQATWGGLPTETPASEPSAGAAAAALEERALPPWLGMEKVTPFGTDQNVTRE